MTDYTLELQPPDLQLVVETYGKDPVVVDYPISVLEMVVDPSPVILPISVARYIFDTPRLQWVIKHNRSTPFVQTTLFNKDGRRIIPRITMDSDNQLTAYFTTPEAGYIDLLFANTTMMETTHVG